MQSAEFVLWVYDLFGCVPARSDLERDVSVTPYDGCYGTAGYVVTVNGSPPRATLIVQTASGRMVAMKDGATIFGRNLSTYEVQMDRYREAVCWVRRLGVEVQDKGYEPVDAPID